ncbi:MAG: hypothetical protein U5J98_04325 [Halobacteriales archaeon]|nr:hypothetical protein [Halobacteriales archaeon]
MTPAKYDGRGPRHWQRPRRRRSRGPGPHDRDRNDPQLLLYRSLRDEVHSRIAQHHRSLLSGLSVIGVVIAYALLSGQFVFLAVIPVVVGFLVVQTVRTFNNILYVARHLSRIEGAYVEDYPLFNWERRYGGGGTDRGLHRWGVDWSNVPQAIVLLLAAAGYLGSIYAAYVVWPPDGVEILLIGLTRTGLVWIYAFLTLLILLSGYSYRLHRAELAGTAE